MAECKHPAAFVSYGIEGGAVCGICGAKVKPEAEEKKPEAEKPKKGGKK